MEGGACHLARNIALHIRCDDPRIERAAHRWQADLHGTSDSGSQNAPTGPAPARPTVLEVSVDRGATSHPTGYRLAIRADRIELTGTSPTGCFHGLQTLGQLSQVDRLRVPCCTILDWPDYPTRGLLHDVTRGKVPTLETLKLLVDRLAGLKVNQLQLYIEHAFVFSFDPEICTTDEGLTPDAVRRLDEYCRERFIDLVPAVANLGHMGRILSMSKYRPLAEIEAARTWADMSWPERARGFTLDCLNPESHRLVERIWSDILDAFRGPVVNICGDEPWDLGKGKNRTRLSQGGTGEAYTDHIRRVHDFCAARGRRIQAWGDVVGTDRHLLDRLPRDLTLLYWGYDDDATDDLAAQLLESGLERCVCPGTSGWKRILNAMDLAERDIARFAANGLERGAVGLLNTDWGDHGHFNSLACSWHGIALGAALAWDARHPTGDELDTRVAQVVFGTDDPSGIKLLRRASRIADRCETWRLLWMPFDQMRRDPTLPSVDECDEMHRSAEQFLRWRQGVGPCEGATHQDLEELAVACRFTQLLTEKVAFAQDPHGDPGGRFGTKPHKAWSERLLQEAGQYAELWRKRNKPSGLNDILHALQRTASEVWSRDGPCS